MTALLDTGAAVNVASAAGVGVGKERGASAGELRCSGVLDSLTREVLQLKRPFPYPYTGRQHCALARDVDRAPRVEQPSQRISQHFDEAIALMEHARSVNGTVLVHCAAGSGVSLSATIVLAYLVSRGWSLASAIVH
ncbi:hypothetical protein PBRA_005270 [Plasmodiophora brassicae]|uniref:protein-tyrosine-phosphatase n=1 Tax=Plasmodiophora brassicae TaxID=37360 RepID=A0A0G4IN58_PLABS|nr:hypothetical protein PBRA_005270 [Plasmodiophora brassicae]